MPMETAKKSKLSIFEPISWLQTECMKRKLNNDDDLCLSEEKRESLLYKFTSENPNSALAKHKERRREQPEIRSSKEKKNFGLNLNDEHEFLKQLNSYPVNSKTCCLKTYLDLFQNCDREQIMQSTFENRVIWNKERQFRITASRCYELFTYSRGDWEMKSKKYFWPKKICTPAMSYGNRMEKEAREFYISRLKYKVVETGIIISQQNPWLGFSPDGIVVDSNDNPVRLLEIKCPVAGQKKSALECLPELNYLQITNNCIRLNPKHKYYGQVQLGMCILNVQICDFLVYSAKSQTFLNIRVYFDAEFSNSLLVKLKENYFMHMLHEVCKENQ